VPALRGVHLGPQWMRAEAFQEAARFTHRAGDLGLVGQPGF